jgi:predicted nucleic acid-binding protein
MRDRRLFLDTNLLVYMHSDGDLAKRERARQIVTDNRCFISTQTLNEFCNVAFRKLSMPAPEIDRIIVSLIDICRLTTVNRLTIRRAIALKDRYGYRFFDTLMIASALECNCELLCSEDMAHGQVIETTRIWNIFIAPDTE